MPRETPNQAKIRPRGQLWAQLTRTPETTAKLQLMCQENRKVGQVLNHQV